MSIEYKSNIYPKGMTVEELHLELSKAIAAGLGKVEVGISSGDVGGECIQIKFEATPPGRNYPDTLWLMDYQD